MAYRKKCKECGEYTYSASFTICRCATCGADIVNVKPEPAGAQKEENDDKN